MELQAGAVVAAERRLLGAALRGWAGVLGARKEAERARVAAVRADLEARIGAELRATEQERWQQSLPGSGGLGAGSYPPLRATEQERWQQSLFGSGGLGAASYPPLRTHLLGHTAEPSLRLSGPPLSSLVDAHAVERAAHHAAAVERARRESARARLEVLRTHSALGLGAPLTGGTLATPRPLFPPHYAPTAPAHATGAPANLERLLNEFRSVAAAPLVVPPPPLPAPRAAASSLASTQPNALQLAAAAGGRFAAAGELGSPSPSARREPLVLASARREPLVSGSEESDVGERRSSLVRRRTPGSPAARKKPSSELYIERLRQGAAARRRADRDRTAV